MMNFNQTQDVSGGHEIILKNRKTMDVTGIKGVGNFNSTQFILETTMGFLIIHGKDMEMKGFDRQKGTVCIHGIFHAWAYQDEKPGEKAKSFFGKLFK